MTMEYECDVTNDYSGTITSCSAGRDYGVNCVLRMDWSADADADAELH